MNRSNVITRRKSVIKLRLLASLKDLTGGKKVIEIEADSWRDALKVLRERYPSFTTILDEEGNPKPGYLIFIDGIDYRLYDSVRPGLKPREVVLIPVNHGGVEFEHVSWNDIEDMVKEISKDITRSGYKVEIVVGILRGGVIPAKLIADELGVDDLGVMEIKLYKGVGERAHKPYIRQPLTLPIKDKAVLIVDDVSDTGLTLHTAISALELYSPRKIKTATLFIKPWTKLIPDYYSRVTDRWIVFPWEKKEVSREVNDGQRSR